MSNLSNLFNEHRDAALPVISEAAAALLEVVWQDDYESFALVNDMDDPKLFDAVKYLLAVVEEVKPLVLSTEEIAALQNGGWYDVEEADASAAVDKINGPEGYKSKVWDALDGCFVLIDGSNGGEG